MSGGRWFPEGRKVWTGETADPELYASTEIQAIKIAVYLNESEEAAKAALASALAALEAATKATR